MAIKYESFLKFLLLMVFMTTTESKVGQPIPLLEKPAQPALRVFLTEAIQEIEAMEFWGWGHLGSQGHYRGVERIGRHVPARGNPGTVRPRFLGAEERMACFSEASRGHCLSIESH